MQASTWRRGATLPFSAAELRLTIQLSRAAGTLVMRRAMTPQSSFVAVDMRSNVPRISCSGEAMTFRAISSSPARWVSSARPRRSFIAAMVTLSMSSAGVALSSAARVRARSWAWASRPAGEKSSSSSSWPGMPR